MQRDLYYKSSNKVTPVGLIVLLLATFVVGSLLSFAYLYAVQAVKVIYFRILFVVVLGVLSGVIGALICKLTKVRNRALAIIVSIIGVVAFNYVKWAAFIHLIAEEYSADFGSRLQSLPELLLNPIQLIAKISLLNESGTWVINNSSEAVRGVPLAGVWIVEFLIIMIAHLFFIDEKVSKPFIEKDNAWAEELKQTFYFREFVGTSHASSIERDPYILLDNVEDGPISTGMFLEGDLFVSSDKSENYLRIKHVTVTNAARSKRTERKIVNYLSVSKDFVDRLIDKASPQI